MQNQQKSSDQLSEATRTVAATAATKVGAIITGREMAEMQSAISKEPAKPKQFVINVPREDGGEEAASTAPAATHQPAGVSFATSSRGFDEETSREHTVLAVACCAIITDGLSTRFQCKFPDCGREYASRDAVRKHCRIRHLSWLRSLERTSTHEVLIKKPSAMMRPFKSKSGNSPHSVEDSLSPSLTPLSPPTLATLPSADDLLDDMPLSVLNPDVLMAGIDEIVGNGPLSPHSPAASPRPGSPSPPTTSPLAPPTGSLLHQHDYEPQLPPPEQQQHDRPHAPAPAPPLHYSPGKENSSGDATAQGTPVEEKFRALRLLLGSGLF